MNKEKLEKMAKGHAEWLAKWYHDIFIHGYGHGWEAAMKSLEKQDDITDFKPQCPPHPGCPKDT